MGAVTVIDYGVGNLFSLTSSLRYIGAECNISSDFYEILAAERVILPGVGAFGDAVEQLRASGLVPAIMELAARGTPLLGICVGMQLLFEESLEFGRHEGLGLLRGSISPLDVDIAAAGFSLKVPQMGWNKLRVLSRDCPILSRSSNDEFFYFVHSYYAKGCEGSVAADVEYGINVPAVVSKGNVHGTQFHPEKSGSAGLDILRAFCELK